MGGDYSNSRIVYMIDCSLARKCQLSDDIMSGEFQMPDENYVMRPPRPRPEFRGSLRYASVNAHKKKVKLHTFFYIFTF